MTSIININHIVQAIKLKNNHLVKVEGIIQYGDAYDQEISDYGFQGSIKKILWIHPNPLNNATLYSKVAPKVFKSSFNSIELIDENLKPTVKRFDSFVKENISFLNLEQYQLVKLNKIAGMPKLDAKKILQGFGKLLTIHDSIKAILIPTESDNKEVEGLLSEFGFEKNLMTESSILYVR